MNFVGSNLAKVQQFIPCKFKCKRFALHFFSICCLKIFFAQVRFGAWLFIRSLMKPCEQQNAD